MKVNFRVSYETCRKFLTENLLFCLAITLLFSTFFGIRHVFYTNQAYITGAYSDFTSFSLYLSDILVFLLLFWQGFLIFRKKSAFLGQKLIFLLIFLQFLSFLFNFGAFSGLSLYFSLLLSLLIVAHETLYFKLKPNDLENFGRVFLAFSLFEGILALIQFSLQRDVGLRFLGEPELAPWILGVAKIVNESGVLIRPYGTFPHANILSAFLVVGALLAGWLWFHGKHWRARFYFLLVFAFHILALGFTFSRAGWIGFIVGMLFIIAFRLWCEGSRRAIVTIIISTVAVSAIFAASFWSYLTPRVTVKDIASIERREYLQIGWKIIKEHPLFGVGPGTSVLHMEQYSGRDLKPWEIQPIHNYYVLLAAESGVVGLILYVLLIVTIVRSLWSNIKERTNNPFSGVLLAIICSFSVMMLFDHYFYTIRQGQMLLWMVLGIALAQKRSPGNNTGIKNYNK